MGGIDVMGVGVLGSRARGWDLHSNKHPMGLVVPADTDYLGITNKVSEIEHQIPNSERSLVLPVSYFEA